MARRETAQAVRLVRLMRSWGPSTGRSSGSGTGSSLCARGYAGPTSTTARKSRGWNPSLDAASSCVRLLRDSLSRVVSTNNRVVFPLVRRRAPRVVGARRGRQRPTGVADFDDASQVLPPYGLAAGPPETDASGAPLWHTASFAAVARTPTPRRKVMATTVALLVALTAVAGYVGLQAAAVAGLLPPSPPRHVVADVVSFRDVLLPAQRHRAGADARAGGPTVGQAAEREQRNRFDG